MHKLIDSDLELLIEKIPERIREQLLQREDINELLEVVIDLGREPEARFLKESMLLTSIEVTEEDIQHVLDRISPFGEDNRAGIERTLHRISAIRNRSGKVIGLTLRVGRAVYGTIRVIEDLILSGQSVLLLGKPGVGKTTMLREVARVLADDARKRVVVVDTSNEIAGDGDVPHAGIGRARRMHVASPTRQHSVMIEAVENHMPEVIIIDEISTEMEAGAARTIAERGVQLVATAHGNTLDNLIINPTLSDLVGGVHTVTLGDIEARRRRTQKTVQERQSPPTFEVLVEIQGWNLVTVHPDVADTVDRILRGFSVSPESRWIDDEGIIQRERSAPRNSNKPVQQDRRTEYTVQRVDEVVDEYDDNGDEYYDPPVAMTKILPYGVNKGKLHQAVESLGAPVEIVDAIGQADMLLTTKNFYRRRTQALKMAEDRGKPVYVLRKNTLPQIQQFVQAVTRRRTSGQTEHLDAPDIAVKEVEQAVSRVDGGENEVSLKPQNSYVRHVQHQIAEKLGFSSASSGKEPSRHVVIYRP